MRQFADYTEQFLNLVLSIPDMLEEEKVDKYARGLKLAIRKEVLLWQCTTLDDAMAVADKMDAILPKSFWAEAVAYANYIQNRIPHSAIPGTMPYELWTVRRPSVAHMRVFGSPAYAQIHKDIRKKFEPKSRPCIFVGFTDGIKGYKLVHKQTRKVIHSRDVVFVEGVEFAQQVGASGSSHFEDSEDESSDSESNELLVGDVRVPIPVAVPVPNVIPAQQIPVQQIPGHQNPVQHIPVANRFVAQSPRVYTPLRTPGRVVSNRSLQDSPSSPHVAFDLGNGHEDASSGHEAAPPKLQQRRKDKHSHLAPRQSARTHRQPEFYEPEDFRHPKTHLTYCLNASAQPVEPQSYAEAMSGPDADLWKVAIDSELASLHENDTWTLTSLPAGRKAVSCKWVFKIKLKADGSVERYKGRVVAKGCG